MSATEVTVEYAQQRIGHKVRVVRHDDHRDVIGVLEEAQDDNLVGGLIVVRVAELIAELIALDDIAALYDRSPL